MSDAPVMLLDVDGTINATSKQIPTLAWPKGQWKRAKIRADTGVYFPFLWAVPVVDWLTDLHASGRVEIRWHTTWGEKAKVVGQTLGLPVFEVHPCPEWELACTNGAQLHAQLIRDCQVPWWKYPAAERVLTDEGRKLLWVDNDINDKVRWPTRAMLKATHPVELVCPSGGVGLTSKHMTRVEEILTGWEEARGAVSGS